MTIAEVSTRISSGSWAQGLPAHGAGQDACASIPGIAGFLLRYVSPLRDWFDDLLGSPGIVGTSAAEWEDAERAFSELSTTLRSVEKGVDELDGRTIRALRDRYGDLIPTIDDAAQWSGATAAGIRLVSRVIEATRAFICDFLTALGRFAGDLFHFSLNPLDKIRDVKRFAQAAADLVRSGGELVKDLLAAVGELVSLFEELAPLIGDALQKLRDVVADMAPLVGGALSPILGTIGGDVVADYLRTDADMDELDPATLDSTQREMWNRANAVTSLDSLSDLVQQNTYTDALGGGDATAIDVKKVVAADGSTHWVVSLPSTQAWEFTGETGAMNDRDDNVSLMLDNPLLRTQYERAVRDAMSQAGVPKGGDVVLTGFSQGGIMAANLASDSTFPYKTIGVVTNGSPIDTFDVPSDVPVYAFQHATDVVPTLDGTVVGGTPTNVHEVVMPDPDGAHLFGAHNNDLYTQSVKNWEKDNPTAAKAAQLMGGTVVDHQVYSGVEK